MLTRYSSNTDKEMVVLRMEDLNGAELGLIRYAVYFFVVVFHSVWITFLSPEEGVMGGRD